MDEERHETFEGLRRLFGGRVPTAEAAGVVAHLTGCRPCWLLASRAIAAQKAKGELVVQGPLRLVVDLQEAEQARLEEWIEAQAAWGEIRALGIKARRDKVRLTRSLHTLGFLHALLEEGAAAGAPSESEEIYYLALLLAGQLPDDKVSVEVKNDLCAKCCTEMANARRRQAKWPAAREALKKGYEYAARGSRSGVVEGSLLSVQGSLEDDLGNAEEAISSLRRAVELFETAAESLLASKALTRLAYVLIDVEPAEGLRAIERALSRMPDNQSRLAMFAEGIKIDCLLALGAPQEALLRFKALKSLHEQFRDPFVQLRRRFTAARILEHLGRIRKAESLFQEVISGDLEHGLMKDFLLDLVYLFGFYLRNGRSADAIGVCRRAMQELSLLEDEEGSAEAARDQMRAVWRDLEEVVKKGTVDLGAPDVLRNYIKAHWRTPATEPPTFRQV